MVKLGRHQASLSDRTGQGSCRMIGTVQHALMITGFVFVMTLVVEYVSVLTRGSWRESLTRCKWGQFVVAALIRYARWVPDMGRPSNSVALGVPSR